MGPFGPYTAGVDEDDRVHAELGDGDATRSSVSSAMSGL